MTITNLHKLGRFSPRPAPREKEIDRQTDHIRLLGIELDLACNGGSRERIYLKKTACE